MIFFFISVNCLKMNRFHNIVRKGKRKFFDNRLTVIICVATLTPINRFFLYHTDQ
jgi:hypothetical protein